MEASMTVIFWIWGILGLLINGVSWLSLTGNVGVGTSAYMAAAILLWIGGMVLFGFGAVISAINGRSMEAGQLKLETPDSVAMAPERSGS
jgi:hypothetical protein